MLLSMSGPVAERSDDSHASSRAAGESIRDIPTPLLDPSADAHSSTSLASQESKAAFTAARSICRRHAKSFYFASHFLPRPKREAAYAVYAFCRLLDDAVDEAGSPEAMEAGLRRFAVVLDQVYADALQLPPFGRPNEAQLALRAFALTVRRCAIPRRHFDELAQGCRMDLTISRYATWPDLETYCYHVAGVVGLIMCYVFELTEPAARAQAVAMGNAMQLTNILRDIGEDRARGRVYLPQDELRQFGVTDDHLRAGRVTPGFVRLMQFQIDRARGLYAEGASGLAHLPGDGSRLTACVMSTVYGGILGAIERQKYDTFTRRARLSLPRKLARLPLAWRLAWQKTV